MITAGEEHPEFLPRRPEGRDRQGLALWRSGLGRSAQACRRGQGQAGRRRLRHLQGPDRGQQGQDRDRRRHRARPEGCRAGEDGLSGRGRASERLRDIRRLRIPPKRPRLLRPPIPAFCNATARRIEYILIPGAALVGALGVFGIFVALFGKNPLDLYFYMYQGAFGTWFSWQNTLTRAAPLILTALCTALPAQLGLVIIGGEGALLIGALAATGAALALQSAPPLVVQLAMALRRHGRRRPLDHAVGRAAPISRRQRNDLEPAAGLYRARDPQPSGRRPDARSGQPQQAVDPRDRRRQHDRHASPAPTCIGAWCSASSPRSLPTS